MKRKKVEARSRQANWQQVTKAEGLCPRCGHEKLDFNKARGRPFALGPRCRAKKAETQKRLMQARRDAGLV